MESLKKRFIKRALNHNYLSSSLEGICEDDKKEIEDYSLSDLVDEAQWCLSTYFESGHINNPEENSEEGMRPILLQERKQLKKLYLDFKIHGSGKWSKHLSF